MSKRLTASFILSIIGATYQMISLYLAIAVDRNTSVVYYAYGFFTVNITSFIAIWSAAHILEDWKGRITWPFIIFALGVANLSTVWLTYVYQNFPSVSPSGTPSLSSFLVIVPGPLFLIIGGLLGFFAVRQYSREHGRAVISHA
jgi:hypothetical protein